MSNTPGISPITPDIEEVRHSDDDAYDDEDLKPGTDEAEDDPTGGEGRNRATDSPWRKPL